MMMKHGGTGIINSRVQRDRVVSNTLRYVLPQCVLIVVSLETRQIAFSQVEEPHLLAGKGKCSFGREEEES